MTVLTQQLVPAVTEANRIIFQLCSRGDMLSCGATRNLGMEVAQSVVSFTTGKYQWDDRTGSDADHDVQGEASNKHSWTDGKKTVNIYTELDELIATSERAANAAIREVLYSASADHATTQ